MSRPQKAIHYQLELKETAGSSGYFSAVPQDAPAFDANLLYLRRHPADSFMYAYLLECLKEMDPSAVMGILESTLGGDPVVQALIYEAATLHSHLSDIKKRFKGQAARRLSEQTPLVYLRSELLADQPLHRQWARLFSANINRHRPLPLPDRTGFSFPVDGVDGSDVPLPPGAHVKAVISRRRFDRRGVGEQQPPLEETIARALTRLSELDVFDGPEMRHQSSLSLYALLRRWRFSRYVRCGTLDYTLSGIQTSYGRGLSLEAARASSLMEVVERWASFADVNAGGVVGTRRPHPLIYGSRSKLQADGFNLLDPNRLGLEVPYQNDPLYWMEGECLSPDATTQPIWVPVQCVFLFCNLDERSMFSGLGSTGLASGNTMAEARLSALYELIERDGDAVNPYHPSRCFRVYAQAGRMKALFDDYRSRGIHVYFQDTSPTFGIPACACWVTGRDGSLAKGGGANLNGKRAVLSALTETPFPYPAGPASAPSPPDLPWLEFETLPDFSTGRPDQDLWLVEQTLTANGFFPIYLDITRRDVDIPVAKALIPGFEMEAEFDQYSRISRRLFNNYLKIHKNL